ncbi:unnamed protein product [Lota lota]
MTERRRFIDIQAKSNTSRGSDQNQQVQAENPRWTRSDNTFKFNFVAENHSASTSLLDTTPPSVELSRLTVCKVERSEFAFNFQIPAVTPEHMDPNAPTERSEHSRPGAQEPAPPITQEACVPSESLVRSKPKKKKKSGKNKTTERSQSQEKTSSSEGSHGDKDSVLTAEQQLQRELDWCIEQLELGLKTQKGTPKQKEDASRALKILRSCKAPLAKKRQVMRAMTGDYRKRMEEEKEKQLKLIQRAMTSLQVTTVSGSPTKSVFHRRAGPKAQVLSAGEQSPQPASDPMQSEKRTSFVFTPSKEEFKFNFV